MSKANKSIPRMRNRRLSWMVILYGIAAAFAA